MQQWKEAGADTSYGPLLQQASEIQIKDETETQRAY